MRCNIRTTSHKSYQSLHKAQKAAFFYSKRPHLLRGLQCHVNLIPLNDVPERGLKGVTEAQVKRFLDTLTACHISATRRREMGDDIEGACGQLRRRETLGIRNET